MPLHGVGLSHDVTNDKKCDSKIFLVPNKLFVISSKGVTLKPAMSLSIFLTDF
jgi:hypothetical protein